MKTLVLYSGTQCHLCDLAYALLQDVDSHAADHVEKIDVASDHQLYHLYGARIPVVKRLDSGAELGWPFDVQQLKDFLA